MRRQWVMGNWKMHGSTAMATSLLGDIQRLGIPTSMDCAVSAPFVYLPLVQSLLKESAVAVGVQDVSAHEQGAYTGEVSAAMLADLGCDYAIIGHSERRQYHQESSALVAEKFCRAHAAGIKPVLCIGETLEDREAGRTETVVGEQLQAVLSVATEAMMADTVIAYEPVWAIGTGKTATPEQVQEVHAFLRKQVGNCCEKVANCIRIVYGGSVKPGNAEALFRLADVDGGLIGGAALKAEDFVAICQATQG